METENNKKHRKAVIGVVSSNKMLKTITVKAERRVKHPKYGKYVKRVTVYKAHDEENKAVNGDRVEIVESRPISKDKRWRLVRIVK
ncbi:30S ribosomal protein S17 [Candidatus Scalindua japonica]|uniref:Small ribosomal subunit protein uS17 n=1 Tax=Candidatus Scalindua japonica TaxID=1284222 RepID=A0A286U2B6_9BACT|nr:30S ribosomal protein S17 [Candidatus Scalindua japonica]GAX62267.1 30S ribosomal protein S17 [Candidatus Scalindua japonica]